MKIKPHLESYNPAHPKASTASKNNFAAIRHANNVGNICKASFTRKESRGINFRMIRDNGKEIVTNSNDNIKTCYIRYRTSEMTLNVKSEQLHSRFRLLD